MKTVLTFLLLTVCVTLFAEDVSVKPAGEGTEESPYLFDRLENFFWLRQQTSEMVQSVPVYCKQIKDIDASATQQGGDYAWSDINFSQNNIFVYDGQGYTIYGLEPNEKGALFGTGYMQLKNIRIQGAEGIKTCALAKNLYSDKNKNGYFENCHIKGLLVGTPALAENVSGSAIKIEGCVVEANIEQLQGSGAIVKLFRIFGDSFIKNNCFKGKIKTTKTVVSGMICSLMFRSNDAQVTIEDCYSSFDVAIVPKDHCHFAGLIYEVLSNGTATNGMVNIERCYVSGTISGALTVNNKAFIWGTDDQNSTVDVKDCYYNESINLPDDYAIAKNDEEMKKRATFENWDFEDVWDIDEGEGTPYLRCELPEPRLIIALLLLSFLKNKSTINFVRRK